MCVGHSKPGHLFDANMYGMRHCQHLSLRHVINNHLVPNSASLFGHFDNRISIPYRI